MSNDGSTSLIERLRRRIAWWVMPADREDLRVRSRLVERDVFDEGRRQLAYIQRQLGINRWEKPEPYNVDSEEYPTGPETPFDYEDFEVPEEVQENA